MTQTLNTYTHFGRLQIAPPVWVSEDNKKIKIKNIIDGLMNFSRKTVQTCIACIILKTVDVDVMLVKK